MGRQIILNCILFGSEAMGFLQGVLAASIVAVGFMVMFWFIILPFESESRIGAYSVSLLFLFVVFRSADWSASQIIRWTGTLLLKCLGKRDQGEEQ